MYDITISGTAGDYTPPTGKATLKEENLAVSREADRSVATGELYEIGDLQFDPVKMQLDIRISSPSGLAGAIAIYDEIMTKAASATKIVFGPYERPVFGLSRPIITQRLVNGYRLSLTFVPSELKWTITASGVKTWL